MNRIVIVFISMALISCASDFNKKKPLSTDQFLGETILRQDGNLTNKFQVFDKIGRNEKEKKELIELKKDYIMAVTGSAVGGLLIGTGIVDKHGMSKILIGGLLGGLGYYFGLRTDEKLAPFIKQHNNHTSSHIPEYLLNPNGEEFALGLGYNLNF
ncbi:MAG: hypothetical protein ACJAS4_002351 [Bacteriovoracaceae bacterium]|jgi:hypothetical protein